MIADLLPVDGTWWWWMYLTLNCKDVLAWSHHEPLWLLWTHYWLFHYLKCAKLFRIPQANISQISFHGAKGADAIHEVSWGWGLTSPSYYRVAFFLFRDGPLEKLWGGGRGKGNFWAAGIFFVIKFLVWIFLGHSINIFLGLIGVQEFLFHLIFPCANTFSVVRPPPPLKCSNGPSLNRKSYSVVRWRGETLPSAYLMECISSFCPMKGNLGNVCLWNPKRFSTFEIMEQIPPTKRATLSHKT